MTKRPGKIAARSTADKRRQQEKKQPRKLFLKFRVRPLVTMPKSVMFDKLAELVRTGIMPDDLEVAYMSYDRKQHGRFVPGGRISPEDHEDLRKFYEVMVSIDRGDVHAKRTGKGPIKGSVRFESVD